MLQHLEFIQICVERLFKNLSNALTLIEFTLNFHTLGENKFPYCLIPPSCLLLQHQNNITDDLNFKPF